MKEARRIFSERHPSAHVPTSADMSLLKQIASFISTRSSAILATCVYTLWDLRLDGHQAYVDSLPLDSAERRKAESDLHLTTTTVACNGSVVEKYPGYLTSFQKYVDELVLSGERPDRGSIELVPAEESALLGAAIASACVA
jgi:hexokinase